MDGFQASKGILVIAATNAPDHLDKAVLRPGRFDRVIQVPLPDVRGRSQILELYMKQVTMADKENIHENAKYLARGTAGLSGADLKNIVNVAAIEAALRGSKAITMEHLQFAKDKIQMGSERRSALIPEEIRLSTAYHEGGHALMSLYTPGAMPIEKLTVIPRGGALGYLLYCPEDELKRTRKQYIASIDVAMGGRVAEELIYGEDGISSGPASDLSNATETARNLVMRFGFSSKIGYVDLASRDISELSSETKRLVEMEVQRILDESYARAKALISEKRVEHERLARCLIEYETLDLEDIKKAVKGEPLSRPPV